MYIYLSIYKNPIEVGIYLHHTRTLLDFPADLDVTFLRKILSLLMDTSSKNIQQTLSMKQTNNQDLSLSATHLIRLRLPSPSQTLLVNLIIHS